MKTLIFLLFLIPVTVVAQNFERMEADLMSQINERRAKKRIKPLTYEPRHQESTDKWAIRCETNLNHAPKSQYFGETIGNFIVSDLIIEQFFDSPPHKAILMNKEASRVTISVYVTPPMQYIEKGWTVDQPTQYNVVIRTYKEPTSARGL